MTNHSLAPATCVIRDTASRKGRTRSVTPGTTAARHLHYGRIILDGRDAPLQVDTGEMETGLICLRGSATVEVLSEAVGRVPQSGPAADPIPDPRSPIPESYTLGQFDTLYVPRGSALEIVPGADGCDLAELAAPVTGRHPVQFVPFADVLTDPGLHFEAGGPAAKRELNVLIGKNVQAGRIMAGVTFSQPGNWTSWPPHEHAAMLEEAYLYIAMPPPSFGVQLVYTDAHEPELATIVREGDVVLMPAGYHPNVAAPGGSINFLWMMAAIREDVDRQFGVVNVHPDFASGGSGLDPGRSDRT